MSKLMYPFYASLRLNVEIWSYWDARGGSREEDGYQGQDIRSKGWTECTVTYLDDQGVLQDATQCSWFGYDVRIAGIYWDYWKRKQKFIVTWRVDEGGRGTVGRLDETYSRKTTHSSRFATLQSGLSSVSFPGERIKYDLCGYDRLRGKNGLGCCTFSIHAIKAIELSRQRVLRSFTDVIWRQKHGIF